MSPETSAPYLVASQEATDKEAYLSISDTESATGVSKELLRMWERRYGFPSPARNAQGDRHYSPEQIEKLRLIRQLQSCGFRPGKLMDRPVDELERMLLSQTPHAEDHDIDFKEDLLTALRSHDASRLQEFMHQRLLVSGLHDFVTQFMPAANFIVGDEWQKGQLEIHEEHLYTEQVRAVLNVALAGLMEPHPRSPRVMVCTASREPHTLGILMVEALMRMERLDVTSFGPEMPVKSIVQAAVKHRMDVVTLSFSASYASSRMIEFLEDLRFRLPSKVRIWAGGAATQLSRRHVEGVEFVGDFKSLARCMRELTHRFEQPLSGYRAA